MTTSHRTVASLVLACALCMGCGGTDTAPVDEGAWYGTKTNRSNGAVEDFSGLVFEDGTMILEARDEFQRGRHLWTGSASLDLQVPVLSNGRTEAIGTDVLPDGNREAPLVWANTRLENAVISGTYAGGGDNGTFSISNAGVPKYGPGVLELTGTYDPTPPGFISNYQFFADGTLHADEYRGEFTGTWVRIRSGTNAFRLSLKFVDFKFPDDAEYSERVVFISDDRPQHVVFLASGMVLVARGH